MKSFSQYVKEAWGKDTWKATKAHYKLERKSGNKLMHPAAIAGIASIMIPGAIHSIHSGNHAVAAFNTAMLAPSLAPHVKDIIKIRKAIKAVKNRNQVKEASSPYHSNPGDRQSGPEINTGIDLGSAYGSNVMRNVQKDTMPGNPVIKKLTPPNDSSETPVIDPSERSNSIPPAHIRPPKSEYGSGKFKLETLEQYVREVKISGGDRTPEIRKDGIHHSIDRDTALAGKSENNADDGIGNGPSIRNLYNPERQMHKSQSGLHPDLDQDPVIIHPDDMRDQRDHQRQRSLENPVIGKPPR